MKTIGIKLADGSFYPVLQENNPTVKTLELTTAHNNQTKVMVDLYRSEGCTMEDAEYVDSLQIENLIAHPNGEPSISFSVSLDEDNELSAQIKDPETGKESGTSITLVSRTIEERSTTDEYDINDITLDENSSDNLNEEDNKDDDSLKNNIAKAAVGGGLLMAAGALIAKEHDDKEEKEDALTEDDLSGVVDEPSTNDDIEETQVDEPIMEDELPNEIDIEKDPITTEEEVPSNDDELKVDDGALDEELNEISVDDMFQTPFATPSTEDEEKEEIIPDEIEIEKTEEDPLANFGNFDDIMNDEVKEDNAIASDISDIDLDNLDNETTEDTSDTPLEDFDIPEETSTEGLDDLNLDDISSSDDATVVNEDEEPSLDDFDIPEETSTDGLDDLNLDDDATVVDDLPNFDNLESNEESNDDDINSIVNDLPDFDIPDESSTEGLDDLNLDDISTSDDATVVNEDEEPSLDDFDIPEESSTEGLDDFNLDDDATVVDDLPNFDSLENNEESNDDDINSIVSDLPDFDIPEDTNENEETEEFSLDNEEIPEDLNKEDGESLDNVIPSSNIDDILSDTNNDETVVEDDLPNFDDIDNFSTDKIIDDDSSFDLPDDLDTTKSGEDIASDDKFFGNNFGGFGDSSSDELPTFDDDEDNDTLAMKDDDLDLSDLGNFDTNDNNTDLNFDDDFFDTPSGNESSNLSSSSNGGLSFTGLYDKETEMGKPGEQEDDVKKKTKTPVIICIICAIICIIATLLVLFIIPSKYNVINKQVVEDKIEEEVKVEEPVVKEEIKEEVKVPAAKEDEVIIIEQAEEVIPEQPELPEIKPADITYKIRWGDTLWDISNSYYKNPWRYKDIARFNGIKNPDHIISGTNITIPAE